MQLIKAGPRPEEGDGNQLSDRPVRGSDYCKEQDIKDDKGEDK